MATSVAKIQPAAPPLTPEEEDALIHSRIMNDERPLRRLTKKFHFYSTLVYPSEVESSTNTSVDEAREAFLLELAGFQLQLRKARMVCDAEHRQGELYRKESKRIAEEHIRLRKEIEELKVSLELAQLERRRKIEYDQIAEKINNLASREELDLSIAALESDIQVIKDEHEAQDRNILNRKSALDTVISELGKVLLSGVIKADERGSSEATDVVSQVPTMEVDEVEAENEQGKGEEKIFDPLAKPSKPIISSILQASGHKLRTQSSSSLSRTVLAPSMSRENTPSFTPISGSESRPESPAVRTPHLDENEEGRTEEGEEGEDIEMGELEEARTEEAIMEDREEGEASEPEAGSDSSSVLSEPPSIAEQT